jgi:hypothetical protein
VESSRPCGYAAGLSLTRVYALLPHPVLVCCRLVCFIVATCDYKREDRPHSVAICLGLRCVDVAGASITDISIHALAEHCPQLMRLSFPHSSRITDAAFTLLSEGLRLGAIEELDVSRYILSLSLSVFL